jgi:hypothetical protein
VNPRRDIAGQRFARLTALEPVANPGGKTRWLCRCDCGAECSVATTHLVRGRTRSCGCLASELTAARNRTAEMVAAASKPKRYMVTHGMTKSRTYSSWSSMITRCHNPNVEQWPRYGGRGIKVCERWLAFENFLADMGKRPVGMSIDRIDNDRGYEPGNCRWATSSEQARNKSTVKLTMRTAAEIRAAYAASWSIRHLADSYSVSEACIRLVIKGEAWKQ